MAQYVVTANDRSWFGRCRRAWDLGAVARQGLQRVKAVDADGMERAVLEALAVHYFPGMWSWDRTIVEPLVFAAYDRAHGPPDARPVLGDFLQWAVRVDRFTPLRVEVEIDVHVPIRCSRTPTCRRTTVRPCGTATASPCDDARRRPALLARRPSRRGELRG
jgi:hypothetical protein